MINTLEKEDMRGWIDFELIGDILYIMQRNEGGDCFLQFYAAIVSEMRD